MVKKVISLLIIFFVIMFGCEDVDRIWDNPYDPRSDRSTWTPDNLTIDQVSDNVIELNWVAIGKQADGFKIDRRKGNSDWIDTLGVVPYVSNQWRDFIDLKEQVLNPEILTYRLYAYADTNISNYTIVKILPSNPAPPLAINFKSLLRDPKDRKIKFEWEKSLDADFLRYEIKYRGKSDSTMNLIKQVTDINNTYFDTLLSENSVFIKNDNIFFIETYDTTNQSTIGIEFLLNKIAPPTATSLDTITFNKSTNKLMLNWSNEELDAFDFYFFEKGKELQFDVIMDGNLDTLKLPQNTASQELSIDDNIESNIRIATRDVWGNTSYSNEQMFSTFPRIIKLDKIQDFGDLLKIEKYYCGCDECCLDIDQTLKSTDEYSFKDSVVNEYIRYPQWIDNGNKIFGFQKGKIGIIFNKQGEIINRIASGGSILGDNFPKDIDFNNNGTMGLFTGQDHNIWGIDFSNDITPVSYTSFVANEWFQDPTFVDDGQMLFSQKKLTKDNQGISDIWIMNLDANIDTKIQITNATKRQKFVMPSKVPNKTKIIFVNEDLSSNDYGLYEISNYPNNKTMLKLSSVVPERVDFYRNFVWSPNGKKTVFVANQNVYTYDSESTEVKLVQISAEYPFWLNDDEIYFRKINTEKENIYKKSINANQDDPAILFYKGGTNDIPWLHVQPR